MNAIIYALQHIRLAIPESILIEGLCYNLPPNHVHTTSIDEKLTTKVIRGIALIDANIVGGTEVIVPLDGLPGQIDRYNFTTFKIPIERTMGREIVSVLGIGPVISSLGGSGGSAFPGTTISNPTNAGGGCFTGNAITDAFGKVFNRYNPVALNYSGVVELIGPNVVLVQESSFLINNYLGLKCNIENDNNLNNLQPRNYRAFGKLCLLATKAFIYNTLIIELDKAALHGGQDIGRIVTIVESYSDALEQYSEYIDQVWRKVAFMNDKPKFTKYIKTMLTV